jgi:copper homeostasis protein
MYKIFELCAFTIQSCLIAEQAGIARVELCDNPIEGGTTPSYGTIKAVRDRVGIQVFPIIRPRSMNYFYDEEEWEIIQEEVRICKALRCDGISIGVQQQDGTIDADKMKRIVELAWPMQVTCNRVFDMAPNAFEALETLIDAGCDRILTSGQAATAPEGFELLKQLVVQAGNRISVMPGAGIHAGNIAHMLQTGAHEFHGSVRRAVPNQVKYFNTAVSDAGNMYIADENELKKINEILKQQA